MNTKELRRTSTYRDDTFIIVLAVTVVVGMALALALVLLWRNYPTTMTHDAAYRAAVAVCPPFLLVGVVSALTESTLAVVLTGGTIVFANGSLYAGIAALVYWAVSTWRRGSS